MPSSEFFTRFFSSSSPIAFFADLHSYTILRRNFFFYAGPDRVPPDQVQEIERRHQVAQLDGVLHHETGQRGVVYGREPVAHIVDEQLAIPES